MLSKEATNANFIVFGLTRPGLEPTIYRTRGEHANHYATDAVYNFRRMSDKHTKASLSCSVIFRQVFDMYDILFILQRFFFMLVKLSTNHVTVMADSDFLSCNLTEHEIVDYDNTGSVIIT